MTAKRSIKHYLLASWLLSLLIAVLGSAILSVGISVLEFETQKRSVFSKLGENAKTIGRRISAEIQLKDQGRNESVLMLLKEEFKLAKLNITKSPAESTEQSGDYFTLTAPIPDVIPAKFISLSVPRFELREFFNFKNFLFALFPILGLGFCGFLIQHRLLNRYVVSPIQSLAATSTGAKSARDHWPIEIQKISSELAESFSNREQAIFGRLAQGLVHDIRTHINSIYTALQLLAETKPETKEHAERLGKLGLACGRNIPKVKNLLELSLDSSREIIIRPAHADFNQTIQHAIQTLQETATIKGVSVKANFNAPLQHLHDSVQFERVVTNLIKNAVEAAESAPVSKRMVEINSEQNANGLIVHVEDSGPGVVDDKQIFRPFKSTKTHGYGLGLFVSRKIVEAHQGTLSSGKSSHLGGAKFTIHLPKTFHSAVNS